MREANRGMRDWREDPLVIIEKRLYLVAPTLLRALLTDAPGDPNVRRIVSEASDALRHVQSRYMDPFDVTVPAEARPLLTGLADRFDSLAADVLRLRDGDVAVDPSALADALGRSLPQEVEAVMDALRAAFVQTMLDRQACAARSASNAAQEIAQVSRQIFFISINASVEAARAGEAGRGFTVIGQEIRALSERASAALHRMTEGGGRVPR